MTAHITQKILDNHYCDLTERAKIDLDFLLLTVAVAAICALGFKTNSASLSESKRPPIDAASDATLRSGKIGPIEADR